MLHDVAGNYVFEHFAGDGCERYWAVVDGRVGVNSTPELDFLANSKSNSGIGIELELALLSPGGIGIELELPSFELELESELRSSELN